LKKKIISHLNLFTVLLFVCIVTSPVM
jgi:hypothetical protein